MAAVPPASNPQSHTKPYLLEILRSDPFARFLQKRGLTPIGFGFIVFIYGLIRNLVLPAIFGHLFTIQVGGRTILGVLDDWPVLVIEMLMVPVTAGYYLWQPVTMQSLYDGMAEKIGTNPLARARAMEYVRPVRWSGWVVIAFVVGVFETIYIQYVYLKENVLIWETVNGVMIISLVVIRFIIFYMLVFIIVRQIFMIIGLNRFFSEIPVKVTPLHPDRAGGLRILGDYVLSTALIVGAVGLFFGMGIIRREWNPSIITAEFYVLMAVYFFLAPLFFFLPLIQVHRRMAEAKRKLLIEIAEQFDIEYRKLLNSLKNDQMDSNLIQRVEAIQKIYRIANDSPEWPFNLEIISKYSAAVVFPVLLPVIVQVFIEWYVR